MARLAPDPVSGVDTDAPVAEIAGDAESARPDYFSRVNPTLLALLPRHARNVLEVGCGAGALGRAFKAFAPNCRYVGIEYSADAAALAGKHLDQVLCGDIEHVSQLDLDSLLAGGERFDCLVFGDVLEHLRDPWAALRRLLPLPPGRCSFKSLLIELQPTASSRGSFSGNPSAQ